MSRSSLWKVVSLLALSVSASAGCPNAEQGASCQIPDETSFIQQKMEVSRHESGTGTPPGEKSVRTDLWKEQEAKRNEVKEKDKVQEAAEQVATDESSFLQVMLEQHDNRSAGPAGPPGPLPVMLPELGLSAGACKRKLGAVGIFLKYFVEKPASAAEKQLKKEAAQKVADMWDKLIDNMEDECKQRVGAAREYLQKGTTDLMKPFVEPVCLAAEQAISPIIHSTCVALASAQTALTDITIEVLGALPPVVAVSGGQSIAAAQVVKLGSKVGALAACEVAIHHQCLEKVAAVVNNQFEGYETAGEEYCDKLACEMKEIKYRILLTDCKGPVKEEEEEFLDGKKEKIKTECTEKSGGGLDHYSGGNVERAANCIMENDFYIDMGVNTRCGDMMKLA